VPALHVFEYTVVRLVPRVEREEFINVGVILFCKAARFLDARIALDEDRVRALAPGVDLDELRSHLAVIPAVCRGGPEAGPIGELDQAERFRWLASPRSTVIQTSPVHSGETDDPVRELDHLLRTMVTPSIS
jgi:hypothetical protein